MNKTFWIIVAAFFALTLTGCAKKEADTAAASKVTPPSAVTDACITFVELGSVNCRPCKAMQPVMKSIEKKYNGKVKVVFHDVWTKEGETYGRKYMIRAIPTQVFLDEKGNEFFRHEGFFAEDQIDALISSRGIKL